MLAVKKPVGIVLSSVSDECGCEDIISSHTVPSHSKGLI